jgi:hypothetical protein
MKRKTPAELELKNGKKILVCLIYVCARAGFLEAVKPMVIRTRKNGERGRGDQ